MPWDITLKRKDELPLGSPDEVSLAIKNAFSAVEFYREPSGREKLASLPSGVEMPDVIRRHWESSPTQLRGDLEGRGYSLRFYLGNEGDTSLDRVTIEARGDSRRALPMMESLTLATGWIIVDDWGEIIVENGRTDPKAR
jgi:hypothetical protein